MMFNHKLIEKGYLKRKGRVIFPTSVVAGSMVERQKYQ